MAALSPRPANIQIKAQPTTEKASANVVVQGSERSLKDKEHAPAPPEWVIQPPIRAGCLSEKFRSGKYLGKGGFAICHEGTLGAKKYAMKIVRAKMHQKKTEEKFRTELQIHAKLRHPGIVEFHRAFMFEESIYVILELCPNGSIMDMIRRRKCLSLPEVRRYTVQICGAVKYLHSRNVIHRDLKMGNLFLDKNMNIKLGDFGLAAILITEEEYQGTYHAALSRRRTMCGTPNYIAPEILEKRKNGHDHKVDIWSIGVILFAMLTGYPPFQSTTQDEIYRRVKSVEYKWPKDEECMNDIPEEAKDLVALLLTINAEERPDVDRIVGHPFFAMHGGSAIPLVIGNACRVSKPSWLESICPRGDVIKKSSPLLPLTTLARSCGVGHLDGFTEAFEVVGEKVEISLYKECLEEEIAKSYPIVPLPADMVYTGKPDQNGCWASQNSSHRPPGPPPPPPPKPASSKLSAASSVELDELEIIVPEPRRRPTVPSHASTLRAHPYTTLRSRGVGRTAAQPASNLGQAVIPSKVEPGPTRASRPNRGLLNELPVRSASNPSKAVDGEPKAKVATRVTRSQSARLLSISSTSSTASSAASATASTTASSIALASTATSLGSVGIKDQPQLDSRVSDGSNRHRGAQQKAGTSSKAAVGEGTLTEKLPKRAAQPRRRAAASKTASRAFLIGPDEVAECIPKTKPRDATASLRKIRDELESVIKGTSSDATNVDLSCYGGKKALHHRPVVQKWVDYSNRYGVGYILSNGTVGCLFNSDSSAPASCVVVAGAENHVLSRKSAAYAEKDQVVSRTGAPVEFLEDCAADGFKRVIVPAAQYQIKDGATVLEDKLRPGETIHDLEKRKRLTIWDKFAKYMSRTPSLDAIAQLRAECQELSDELKKRTTSKINTQKRLPNLMTGAAVAAGPFVKFHQRLGNVSIWVFGTGDLQFNFPDHTKLLLSPDASWLDFYHLPVHTARLLQRGFRLSDDALSHRSVLSYPLPIIARGFVGENDEVAEVVRVNDLLGKLEFVKRAVSAWLDAGGLGALLQKDRYLKWDGAGAGAGAGESGAGSSDSGASAGSGGSGSPSESGSGASKLLWVSVGAWGGDVRYGPGPDG